MRTKTINVYRFNELSEETQIKVIDNMRDLNISHDWWESTYEDAQTIGLNIKAFALDGYRHAQGEFNLSAAEVAQNILSNHGEECETYKTATAFLEDFNPKFAEYLDESSEHYESKEKEDELQELEDDFLNSLLEDYSILLQKEFEWITSDECISDSIMASEYEFTENGKLA
jgi:hypothetical protein